MAPPERIAGRIEEFFELEPELAERVGPFEIPDFFAREHAAEELRRSRDELAERVAARTEALRRTNRSLQQEVRERRQAERRLRELNEELRVARDRALEASRARSAFLMRMSHELRTPLSAVIGYSELLAEEIGEGDIAARREALVEDLHKIRGASRGLLTMIDEILELTSLYDSSPSVSLEVSGARAIASEVVDQKQASAREHDNTLRLVCRDDPGDLRVDRGRLVGALAHLVDNACRFTRGGDIEVEVLRRRERGEDWIEFTVRDEGIGIDPGRLDEIFEPFSQEDAASAQREGSVGLPLARHLVEGMGGAIEARSEPGRGSAFTVSMPVRIEE
jgi:signal transduction histidine kinase